ncbi:MAG: DinB family protein [Litorilinea sp.]
MPELSAPTRLDPEKVALIARIANLPGELRALTANLTAHQLTTPWLAGEWTVAQNVHHVADSHLNSYIRCKLILTEDHPTLKSYDQDIWAALPDSQSADLAPSLHLLTGLHARWVHFWQTLPADGWARTAYHPENGTVRLVDQLAYYADHGAGHLDQITRTLAAGGIAPT